MIRWKIEKSIPNRKKAKRNFLDVNRVRVRASKESFQFHLKEMEDDKLFVRNALYQAMVTLQ